MLANHALYQGQVDEADQLGRQALDLFQRVGDRLRMAWAHDLLGTVAMVQGKFAQGQALMERGARLYADSKPDSIPLYTEFLLGTNEMHLGLFARARRCSEQMRALGRGDKRDQMRTQLLLGSVALAEGAYAETRTLLEGQNLTIESYRAGRHTLDHAPAVLACALTNLGQSARARRYLLQVLQHIPNPQVFWPLLYVLAAYTLLLIDEKEPQRAVELYALASRYPFVSNSCWFDAVFGRQIAVAAAALPADAVTAAQARGRARDLEKTVAELRAELNR
jgi:tetratricopeptide (TPR) repeat protein